MTSVAVLTDVHADLPALESVLAAIEQAGIRRVWCLGDFCSGGPEPVEAYELVMDRCDLVLAGNHEYFVMSRIWEQFGAWWSEAARLASRALGPERVAALGRLDSGIRLETDDGPPVTLVHAALTDPVNHFIRKPADATVNFGGLHTPLLLFGHTHIPAHWIETDGLAELRLPVVGDPRRISTGRHLLNPGAACDGGGARWLEWDPGAGEVTWHQTRVRGHAARWRP